jgi:hypothetical protein
VLEAVRVAKAMNAPIYTRTVGGAADRSDLSLAVKSPQEMTLVGQRLPVTAQVTYMGTAGRTADVVLLQGGKEVARKTAVLGMNGAADVHFSVTHEKVGVYPYELRVEPFPGEATKTNNSATYVVRVVNEPIRVLVLEGKPYWDSKFFTRTLATDPAVALDCVVKLTEKRLMRRVLTHGQSREGKAGDDKAEVEKAQPGKAPGGGKDAATRDESWELAGDAKSFLSSGEKLRGYQIVVLGRDAEAFVSEESAKVLQEWVARDGGALVCYRGTPTAPTNPILAKLMPVRWSPAAAAGSNKGDRFRMALTQRGEAMQWFGPAGSTAGAEGKLVSVVGMPSMERAARVDGNKPLAVVLAATTDDGGDAQPVVVYQPYGSGRVVVVEGSGMWRWAFLPPAYREQTYASLWHSLMRWLTSETTLRPGQQFLLRADKVRFTGNEPASVTLLARDGTKPAELPGVELAQEGADAKTFAAAPAGEEVGVYRVNFGSLPEGRYTARLAGTGRDETSTTVMFDVRKLDQEMLDLNARPELMARIAAESGGKVLQGDSINEVRTAFDTYQARTRPRVVEKASAWDRGWVLLAILGACAGTWMIRRSDGLV